MSHLSPTMVMADSVTSYFFFIDLFVYKCKDNDIHKFIHMIIIKLYFCLEICLIQCNIYLIFLKHEKLF